MATAVLERPSTPLRRVRTALSVGNHQKALDAFLRAPACRGHRSTGWLIERLPDGREMPLCVDCERPSRLPQERMREV